MGQYNHQPSSLVRGHVPRTTYQAHHTLVPALAPPPPPPPPFSLPVLYCKLCQQTRGQWGQELPLPFTSITHYVPLEPATNNPSEINTAKPDPHMYTASKGAPAATQPEDQCGPHLMPVEKAALTLQMESVTPISGDMCMYSHVPMESHMPPFKHYEWNQWNF